MNTGRAALLSPRRPSAAPQPAWPRKLPQLSLALAVLAILLMHLPTTSAIVAIWLRSPTFNHGMLVLPVAAWLAWRQRAQLAGLTPNPWSPALALLAALGVIWMLAALAHVQVVQQYCLALMCITAVAAVLGLPVTRALAYPLAYTLLAVPFGEVFIPPLIDFTAHFTVTLLQLGGIPVFHENHFIALPSGSWAVADACSGLRYLIASLALGMLYAGVSYRRAVKRLVFIGIALVLPVVANGLRACMVVLIGHWSDMRLAVGVDHLIYGWVFFGLVMALLFWCGGQWRDEDLHLPPSPAGNSSSAGAPTASFARVAVAAVAVCAVWPLLATVLMRPREADRTPEPQLTLPAPPAPWQSTLLRPGDWQTPHRGQPQRLSANYRDGRRLVSLQLTWYRHQTAGAELLAPVRRTVVSGMPQWEEVRSETRTLRIGDRQMKVQQSVQQAATYKLLVWRWYRQAGVETTSPQYLKLLLAGSRLLGGDDSGAEIVLAAPYDEQPAPAEAAMRDLLTVMLPAIDRSLSHVER